jgi:hypothetical protein
MSRAPSFTANVGLDYNISNGEGGLRFSPNVKYTIHQQLRPLQPVNLVSGTGDRDRNDHPSC